ncbi:endoglucanase 1 [Sporothrix schenckii ATCC 58251]|uniref:cellulase n=1 Tax=Sporothrix schenckii (strain ATCC 58251 / de Perez 2211183) TaxID=1391915 RepID=U7PW58_SPOS1|nr:endoglucanase 1 [Sporothrix schenckii ATCC 58251]
MKAFAVLSALGTLTGQAAATIYYAGVAESGGEFGVWSAASTPGAGLPGRFGVDYQFISKSAVDTHIDRNKVNLFRVAFLLERMCPLATGLGAVFNETHFSLYKEAIDYITVTKKAYAILDPHNYMRYNDPSQQPMSGSVIGNSSDPTAATAAQFGAFWGELAGRFKNNSRVMFGLMNEPHDMPSELVLANNQAAVTAIRASGATSNLILAPGNSWTGGHSWTQGGAEASSQWLNKLQDPSNNTAIDIHEYLDVDYSGTHAACTADAATNLAHATAWLRENNLKAFITEFGASNATGCADMLGAMLDYMAANDEYIGWTAWAAGPIWGTASPCCTDSKALGSLEPGSKASDGGPSLYDTVWTPVIQPKVPAKLQWTGGASVHGGDLTARV